jgi:DNA primase
MMTRCRDDDVACGRASGVFVDFGQNSRADDRAATRHRTRVSAPLRWEEVTTVDPAAFTVETMRRRVADIGDPTAGMWRRKVSLGHRFPKLGLELSDVGSKPAAATARRRPRAGSRTSGHRPDEAA